MLSANEKFEIKSKLFERRYGFLPPGNDEPVDMSANAIDRLSRWHWYKGNMALLLGDAFEYIYNDLEGKSETTNHAYCGGRICRCLLHQNQ